MSSVNKILKDMQILDNEFWNQETFADGLVVLQIIQCQKVADQVEENLYDQHFTLEEAELHEEVILQAKTDGEATPKDQTPVKSSKQRSEIAVQTKKDENVLAYPKKNQEVTLHSKNVVNSTVTQEVHIEKIRVTEGSIISVVNPKGTGQVGIIESRPSQSNGVASPLELTDFKKIEHERLVFRNEVARPKNSYFLRAKEGGELYKLGDNFYKDYKAGRKHFSFAHIGAADTQKKSILGIASFIHYFENLNILILTSRMDKTYYSEFKAEGNRTKASISAYPEFCYDVYHHEGISYVEVEEIEEESRLHEVKGLEYILKKVVDDYDIILYDLPQIKDRKKQYHIYFPLLQFIENVTLTVSLQKSKFHEVEALKKYFSNYQIKLKGCVVGKDFTEREVR